MSATKQEIINKISKNFPNLYKKDINKLFDIVLLEITKAIANNERVELRDAIIFEAKSFKARYARDPRNNQKVFVPDRKLIKFKISKKWQKEINEK